MKAVIVPMDERARPGARSSGGLLITPIIDSGPAASYLRGMIVSRPLRRFRLMAGSLLTRHSPRAEGVLR